MLSLAFDMLVKGPVVALKDVDSRLRNAFGAISEKTCNIEADTLSISFLTGSASQDNLELLVDSMYGDDRREYCNKAVLGCRFDWPEKKRYGMLYMTAGGAMTLMSVDVENAPSDSMESLETDIADGRYKLYIFSKEDLYNATIENRNVLET